MSEPSHFGRQSVASLREQVDASLDDFLVRRRRLAGALVLLVLAGAAWLLYPGNKASSEPVESSLPRAVSTTAVAPAAQPAVAGGEVVVQVAGAVERPGVYRLTSAARVADAVDKAGGLSADADAERLNLAAKVADGQRVYVVRRGQASPPAEINSSGTPSGVSGGGDSGVVDINTATAAELDTLPGVGPATAQAIIAYRDSRGPFRSVTDLGKVKGIGPAKLAELRSRVRV